MTTNITERDVSNTAQQPKLTPTQAAIMAYLSDGQRHLTYDVLQALSDELASPATLRVHVCNIRKKIQPLGEDILCEVHGGRFHYRWVYLAGRR